MRTRPMALRKAFAGLLALVAVQMLLKGGLALWTNG